MFCAAAPPQELLFTDKYHVMWILFCYMEFHTCVLIV